MSHTAELVLASIQCALLAPLAILGFHRGWMVLLYWKNRGDRPVPGPEDIADGDWPHVTIQLPIYNERLVASRLVECVALMDYPRDKFEIQVLDDSNDDTTERVLRTIDELRASHPDLDINLVRRPDRVGYKAGALEYGMKTAKGEFLAVFDADFMPPTNFLRRTIPSMRDPKIGMVQARWGHLNADFSVLTDVQRTLLDGHFVVEHTARSRSNCFFNFNGTAGVFRRACIDDAGGWQHDTLTEDMDLSYRAQLKGWNFRYLPDLVCPAELPIEMNAFFSQQHRWAKGSIQTGKKLLGRVLRAPISVLAKGEAIFHLIGNVAFPLLLLLILVGMPLQLLRAANGSHIPDWLRIFEATPVMFATLCLFFYYGIARKASGTFRTVTLLRLPLVFSIGAGMCINNTLAVLSALGKDPGEFRRTPKRDVVDRKTSSEQPSYRSHRGLAPVLECGLALWAGTTSVTAFWIGIAGTGIFHGLFAIGLAWAGIASILEDHRRYGGTATPKAQDNSGEHALPANS